MKNLLSDFTFFRLLCCLPVLLFFCLSGFSQAGTRDLIFHGDGVTATDFPNSSGDNINAIAVEDNNRITAVGIAKCVVPSGELCFAVARYNFDGTLDTSFNTQGFIRTWVLGSSVANGVAIQNDGKIVVVGETTYNGAKNFAIVRYLPSGSLDPTFSGDGIQIINFQTCISCHATSVAIDSDGKIVVAGEKVQPSGVDFAIVRLESNGERDLTFGSNGRVTTSLETALGSTDRAKTVLIQPDKKILVGGTASLGFWLARYNPDGSLDSSFGIGGKAAIYPTGQSNLFVNAFALQSDGKIVGVGHNSSYLLFVTRINPNGSLDSSYNGGYSYFRNQGISKSIAVTTNGNIVAVGDQYNTDPRGFYIACFNSNAQHNPLFGSDGEILEKFYSNSATFSNSIVLQKNGKLLVGGYTGMYPISTFSVSRYLMTGL
jgi:uncharacterized delta-60 repeat protein